MNQKGLTPWRSMLSGDPFERMHRQIDELFSNSWLTRNMPALAGSTNGDVMPSIDVSSDDKQITVTAELPGMAEKDVEVSLEDNILTIRGEKKSEREEKDEKKNWYLMERSYGSFQRSVQLGVDVDASKVKATFDKGVLKVELPKAETAKAKTTKIAVQKA